MTPQEVLLKAVDVIHERGWWNKGMLGPDGSVCLVGTVHIAIGGDVLEVMDLRMRGKALSRVNQELTNRLGVRVFLDKFDGEISNWNDRAAKDADEICDLLKRAAELC